MMDACTTARRRRWLVRVGLAGVVATTLAVIPAGVDRADSTRRLESLEGEVGDVTERRDEYRTRNALLRNEIRGLRGDRRAIEERARRDLGMVYPGELVIVVDDGGGQ